MGLENISLRKKKKMKNIGPHHLALVIIFNKMQMQILGDDGIVYYHMLIVMKAEGIKKLPDTYVLKRWTKHAKKVLSKDQSTSTDGKFPLAIMKNTLYMSIIMCMNKACYNHATEVLNKLLENLREMKNWKQLKV